MSESNNNNNRNINEEVPDPEEWEEWDGKSPFWIHCVAGSMAGVAEHTVVFPLDTVRTHIQVCASCNFNPQTAAAAAAAPSAGQTTSTLGNVAIQHTTPFPRGAASASTPVPQAAGMFQTIRTLVSQPLAMEGVAGAGALSTSAGSSTVVSQVAGFGRLWRGVQSVLIGCIPAHALYFGSYEFVKASTLDENGEVTAYGSALAGAAAVTGHDMVLAPLDTVKQRLQLGHYRGLSHALSTMIANEGLISLYRSFPITLASNIPYGIVMVGTNEFLKQQWSSNGDLTLGVTMASSSMAGFVAAGVTTPLDRIKTSLQTQQLAPACAMGTAPPDCPMKKVSQPVVVAGWRDAAIRIYETEGMTGFFRGLAPRVLSHTPAVAISWTAYETFKRYLQRTEW